MTNEKVGRNDPCPCGSGKKYKKCCANKLLGSRKISSGSKLAGGLGSSILAFGAKQKEELKEGQEKKHHGTKND